MSAADLQALLRFLSQDAKVPLATALAKVKGLQQADLNTVETIAKAKIDSVKVIFEDEKISKQVLSAAKRVTKKRVLSSDDPKSTASPVKKVKRGDVLFKDEETLSPSEIEQSLTLPKSHIEEDALREVELVTNRAPLVLAFVVTLLKHTMPEQPLSSRLSLAQAYVSITSRSRAVNLGIESGKSAEEEGFGDGQPTVKIMGKDIRVLRRYGYEWKDLSSIKKEELGDGADQKHRLNDINTASDGPPLWALDLEAMRKSQNDRRSTGVPNSANNLPIYTAQAARSYLLKSFGLAADKKTTASARAAERANNLGNLLQCLDLLYDSWACKLTPKELDDRTWGWYVKVRPDVENGVAGWGGKNMLRLRGILNLRPGA